VKFKFLRWQNILFYGEWKLALESFKYWFQTNLYLIILSIIAFIAMVLILLRLVHQKQITNWEKQIAQIEKTLEKYGYKRQSHQTIEEWGQHINWDKLPLAESKVLKDSWEYYTQNRFSK
jgi:hypothetical protein